MRKVTYGAAASFDGYLAGREEALDWLLWSDDAAAISGDSWKGVDTILMGRKTYSSRRRAAAAARSRRALPAMSSRGP